MEAKAREIKRSKTRKPNRELKEIKTILFQFEVKWNSFHVFQIAV